MKPFSRMTCQAVALRRLILVSSLAFAGMAHVRSFHPATISRIMV